MGPRNYRRLAVLTALLLTAFAGIGWRLVDVQLLQHNDLASAAEKVRQTTIVQAPLRGRILDRRGLLLAGTSLVKTVVADPHLVSTNYVRMARLLACPLGVPEPWLADRIRPRQVRLTSGRVVPLRHVVVKTEVTEETWQQIRRLLEAESFGEKESGLTRSERMRRLAARRNFVHAILTEPVDRQVRFYPAGALASHVLGFTSRPEPGTDAAASAGLWGVEGIEKTLDNVLRGLQGWRGQERLRRSGVTIDEMEEGVSARAGLNVVLTLDATLQAMVENELAAAWEKHHPASISCVVVDPQTGEILALASLPNFDPNRPGQFDAESRRNRVITDLHEPGSTFKVVTISGALDAGVVTLQDRFDCGHGRFYYRGSSLGDVHPYDVLTVESIVAKSSNIGAAQVGIRMGEGILHDAIRRFGLGERTGIPLPGERIGTVHPTNRWSKISVAWIPMGHEVDATPLQMVMAMCAVANGGQLVRPMLVRRLEDERGRVVETFTPVVRRRVLRPETSHQMIGALRTAVEEGTGKMARVEEYAVAGKTGTAQKIVDGAYVHNRHFASFIGFLPADGARLCVGVFLDEPQNGRYGGETAAPIFQAVARQAVAYLGVPPAEAPADAETVRRAQLAQGPAGEPRPSAGRW